jgi:hypothetical protein
MQEVGINWERVTVAKLESGRRGFIRIDETLGLCVVLQISLCDLLVPADVHDDRDYRIVPNGTARAVNAREFLRGEQILFLAPHPVPEQDPDVPWAQPIGIRAVDSIQFMPPERGARVDQYYTDIEEADQ